MLCPIDFWSTTCPNCPAAVDVLQTFAAKYPKEDVAFLIINTNSLELAKPFIESKKWTFGTHYHVKLEVKEALKRFLGMKTLPNHVMLDSEGKVVGNGKLFNWNKLEVLAPIKKATALAELDENTLQPRENPETLKNSTTSGVSECVFTLDEDF